MQTFLDQVSERVTALVARLIASHIEVKCAEHQAEVQCRIDELASHYDQIGQTEIAIHLRSLRQKLATDAIVPSGEALLNQIQNQLPTEVGNLPGAATTELPSQAVRPRRSATKRILSLVDEAPRTPESQADAVSTPLS